MTDTAKTLQSYFGVEAGSGRIAAALYAQDGRWLAKPAMIKASGRTPAGMDLCLKLLRAAMDPGSIECLPSVGWRLTAIGLADCRAGLPDAEGVAEPNDAQLDFLAAAMRGEMCMECGDPIEPGEPCATCAEKREMLRQVFPRLHGDA